MPRNQILVIRGGAIGDFIVTLPVFAALREMFPQTRLEAVSYTGVAQLALAGGLLDGHRPIESRQFAGFFAGKGDLDKDWSTYFNQFSVIISYLYDPDEHLQNNIKRVSEAQFIQGPHRPDETQSIHATDALLKPLERLAIFGADPLPKLKLNADSMGVGRWLAIHPGSGSESKNWPINAWANLVQELIAKTSWRILVVGGEAEGKKLEVLQKVLPTERGRVLRNASLTSLGQTLKGCDLFLGHDSGISHLAASLDVSCVLLWGFSNQAVWAPRNPKVRILSAGANLTTYPVESVLSQL